jgi:hypothetical protein
MMIARIPARNYESIGVAFGLGVLIGVLVVPLPGRSPKWSQTE